MKYVEPIRMRDELALEMFGKTFEELTDKEKMQVQSSLKALSKGGEKIT